MEIAFHLYTEYLYNIQNQNSVTWVLCLLFVLYCLFYCFLCGVCFACFPNPERQILELPHNTTMQRLQPRVSQKPLRFNSQFFFLVQRICRWAPDQCSSQIAPLLRSLFQQWDYSARNPNFNISNYTVGCRSVCKSGVEKIAYVARLFCSSKRG